MEEDGYDILFKIILVGDTSVGKTNIINKYIKNEFHEDFCATIGVEFSHKQFIVDNHKIKAQIWDTAGQERFRNITKNYFNSSNGFLLIYDITDKESLEHLNFWNAQIQLNAPAKSKSVLLGNKCDLEGSRAVSIEEGKIFAKKNKIKFFETSAKNGTNIDEAFEYLANEIYNEQKMEIRSVTSSQVLSKSQTFKSKKKCC